MQGNNEVLTAFPESTEFQQLNCPPAESMQLCLDSYGGFDNEVYRFSYGDFANKVYKFEDELRNGAMSSFWQSYIEIIQILFDYPMID